MGLHGTLLEEVLWPIGGMGLHGTLLEEVPWPIEGMGLHCTRLLFLLSSEIEGSKLPDWHFSFKKFL